MIVRVTGKPLRPPAVVVVPTEVVPGVVPTGVPPCRRCAAASWLALLLAAAATVSFEDDPPPPLAAFVSAAAPTSRRAAGAAIAATVPVFPNRDLDLDRDRVRLRDGGGDEEWRLIRISSEETILWTGDGSPCRTWGRTGGSRR